MCRSLAHLRITIAQMSKRGKHSVTLKRFRRHAESRSDIAYTGEYVKSTACSNCGWPSYRNSRRLGVAGTYK